MYKKFKIFQNYYERRKIMQIYDEVPSIISCKDLDYLCDMFNWNYGAYKTTYNSVSCVEDPELKDMLKSAVEVFQNNINKILNILSNGGSNE